MEACPCPAPPTCVAPSRRGSGRAMPPRFPGPREDLARQRLTVQLLPVLEASSCPVDDTRAEGPGSLEAGALAFRVLRILVNRYQQRLDPFVEVAGRDGVRAGGLSVLEHHAGGVGPRQAVTAKGRRLSLGLVAEPIERRQPILSGQFGRDGVVAASSIDLGQGVDVVPSDEIVWYAIEQTVSLD